LVTFIPNAFWAPTAGHWVAPGRVAAVLPSHCGAVLGWAEGVFLAAGRPEQHAEIGLDATDSSSPTCNDPFARYLRRRMPEVLTDYLELVCPAPTPPAIVVSEEFVPA
ncbi:hypothetical protein, partial [Nocardia cyriacigeorgica]|uniref:hypothetical protein n=1 Tax=Nocardia cyriacigeorgica TaxID=135487 RepID=UPI002456726F